MSVSTNQLEQKGGELTWMRPGQIAFTRTFVPVNSYAVVCAIEITAAFDAE